MALKQAAVCLVQPVLRRPALLAAAARAAAAWLHDDSWPEAAWRFGYGLATRFSLIPGKHKQLCLLKLL